MAVEHCHGCRPTSVLWLGSARHGSRRKEPAQKTHLAHSYVRCLDDRLPDGNIDSLQARRFILEAHQIILTNENSFGNLPLFAAGLLNAQNNLTTAMTQRYFAGIRKNLEASAEAMPAEKYSFRLTPGQMSFGEWLNHSIQRNYADCDTLKGETAKRQPANFTEKSDIVKGLHDSFAYCESVLATLDDAKVASTPQMASAFMHIAVHNNEIYGNIVGYMRASGIVPPSTAARQQKK